MTKRPVDGRIDFLSPLSLVDGLGPKRVAALQESGLATIGDLLCHFPHRYVDRSHITALGEIKRHINQTCTIIGTITRTRVETGRRMRLRIQVGDESGGTMEALWFNGIPFLRGVLEKGKRVLLTGKVSVNGNCQMVHPQMETLSPSGNDDIIAFLPVYSITAAMREVHVLQKSLLKSILWIFKNCSHYPQILPKVIEEKYGFPPFAECLKQMHLPDNPESLKPYRDRLCYEELWQRALTLRWSKREFAQPGRMLDPGNLPESLESLLPFSLTDAQRTVIAQLFRDAAAPTRMHRLLHGDVGCGKTVVALFACLPALKQALQVAWMTPTEALATQTHALLCRWLIPLGFKPVLMKGDITAVQKKEILNGLRTGAIPFVVGTHVLMQSAVTFARLGMIVIDEQHKFGAEQRLALQRKDPAADFLLLSATPIPQTLAKTLYGDLDIVTITALPIGRVPVRTHLVRFDKRSDLLGFVKKEVAENSARVFYIVPRIDGGEDDEILTSAVQVYDEVRRTVLAEVPTGCVHGRLPSAEKERIMLDFCEGQLKMIVATTVVEVGIDVPEATIVIIENPEMFGLSQLHQLRGRVGRGSKQGYCFLLVRDTLEESSYNRLKQFCRTTDGFAIAELDLSLRGPGQLSGSRQTGWDDFKFADILRDAGLFMQIRRDIDSVLNQTQTNPR
jgi:ATP-dependent DNA helicase RecG